VRHEADKYRAPKHEHGTHVAGILGADWRATDTDMPIEDDLRGICPEINSMTCVSWMRMEKAMSST